MLTVNLDIPTTYHNLKKYEKRFSETPEGREDAREAFYKDLVPIVLEDKPDIGEIYMLGWKAIPDISNVSCLCWLDVGRSLWHFSSPIWIFFG